MSARGAADFLTRSTKWLAVIFVGLAIIMAAVAVKATSGSEVDDTLKRTAVPAAGAQPAPETPAGAPSTAPAQPTDNDPLKNVAQ